MKSNDLDRIQYDNTDGEIKFVNECPLEPSDTDTETSTNVILPSNSPMFSGSSSFTDSEAFSKSNPFRQTQFFSNSDVFSETFYFSNSKKFTKSEYFTDSLDFLSTIKFS